LSSMLHTDRYIENSFVQTCLILRLLAADQEEEVEMFELETTQDRFRPQFLAKFKNSFQRLKIKLL